MPLFLSSSSPPQDYSILVCLIIAITWISRETHSIIDVSQVPTLAREMIQRVQSPEFETKILQELLYAMHDRPYPIETVDYLKAITRIADFYCALPILSATIVTALLGSPMFKIDPNNMNANEFADHSEELILIAQKLRNHFIFRECFIHVVGKWDGTKAEGPISKSPEILRLVMKEYGFLACKVA